MQRPLTADSAAELADAYPAVAQAPERQDDLAFFTGLWAIIPIALGGWTLLVWAAIRLFG